MAKPEDSEATIIGNMKVSTALLSNTIHNSLYAPKRCAAIDPGIIDRQYPFFEVEIFRENFPQKIEKRNILRN